MKRRINLQTKVLWITYLILAFTFKDNLICNCLPTFGFFMAKAFMHLFFGMINQEEMREIKNKCSSKDNWIDYLFLLAGVIMFLEFLFILICSYRREFILESPNYYLILYLPNIGFAILNLLMAINIHKIKSIRANSNEVDMKINCSKIGKINNDELNDKTEKWNPAQELLISYIKECELSVFEVEKVHDFIRNEIKAKRDKRENT